jgi:hypothetical protein
MSVSGSTCEVALKWSTPLHKTSPTKALEKCLWESRPQTAGLSQETLPDSTNTPAESLSNRLANVTEEVVDAVGPEPEGSTLTGKVPPRAAWMYKSANNCDNKATSPVRRYPEYTEYLRNPHQSLGLTGRQGLTDCPSPTTSGQYYSGKGRCPHLV